MYSKKLKKFYKIISRMPASSILIVGDIMLDRFIWGTVSRISPEAPVPVVWAKSESFMPGGASNVANNIRCLGAEAHICGVIGDDEPGRILVSELAKNGIKADGVVLDRNRPTIHKTRIIAHHQQVVRIDKESDIAVDKGTINTMISYIRSKINSVNAIVIEDYGKGVVSPCLIKELVCLARRHKKIITVDPKEEHFNLYTGITSITPNRSEAENATGVKIKDARSLQKAGNALLKILKSESVLITLGEDGMALFRKNMPCMCIPTAAREVYDVSGAGDTVISVFTLALSAGADMEEASYIANAAAGVVVGKLGIGICDTRELKSYLRKIRPDKGIREKPGRYFEPGLLRSNI
ncbi:MAG: D-glycero-beta-D-manno-heptose-7-phosphate kinase [Candidatus Omnitrophica bacterium]|nr:D-glycero-beta-D-manno-heptose-7-phosphate kinase [Candidatus Omnitrophota bacterium]